MTKKKIHKPNDEFFSELFEDAQAAAAAAGFLDEKAKDTGVPEDDVATDQPEIFDQSLTSQKTSQRPVKDQSKAPLTSQRPVKRPVKDQSKAPLTSQRPVKRPVKDQSKTGQDNIFDQSLTSQDNIVDQSLTSQDKATIDNSPITFSGVTALIYEWFLNTKNTKKYSHDLIRDSTRVAGSSIVRALRIFKKSNLLLNSTRDYKAGVTRYDFNINKPVELIKNKSYLKAKSYMAQQLGLNQHQSLTSQDNIVDQSLTSQDNIVDQSKTNKAMVFDQSKNSSYNNRINEYNTLFNLFYSDFQNGFSTAFPNIWKAGVREKELAFVFKKWKSLGAMYSAEYVTELFEKLDYLLLKTPPDDGKNYHNAHFCVHALSNFKVKLLPGFQASWQAAEVRSAEIDQELDRETTPQPVVETSLSPEAQKKIDVGFKLIWQNVQGTEFQALFALLPQETQDEYAAGNMSKAKIKMKAIYRRNMVSRLSK